MQRFIQRDAIHQHLCQADRGAQLANQSWRVRARPTYQRSLFKYDDIPPAALGQVIGDTGTGDAAAYDDDSSLVMHDSPLSTIVQKVTLQHSVKNG